jgi:acyl-CoA synthetase (AMP-forming)/AMP-acid ligase II
MEITQPLHRALQLTPDRPYTILGDRVRTVAESAERTARLAGALQGLGAVADDRIAILSLNSDIFHETLLGVPWAGGVVVPVNFRWSPVEIAQSLDECGVAILIVDDMFLDLAVAVLPLCPGLATVIHAGEKPTPEGMLRYEELLAATQPVENARRGGADLYGIFYTGGTTGVPKGVVLSHDNMMTSAFGCVASGEFLTQEGRLMHVAPMFHLADIASWTGGLILNSTHIFVPAFTPAGALATIARHGATDVLVVPTMLQMMVDSPEAHDHDLSSMRHIVYGASPISEALLDRAAALFPQATFLQAYGMSELAPVATMLLMADHQHPEHRRSAGRAGWHVEVRVVDENDVEVPRGVVGEIVARGGATMVGYWNRPAETAEALRGGWMHTGDGGYMDHEGYVFVVDRIKDMIITGGENVYSIEVENVVAKHPAVAAVAIIGLPDEQWGERVHAVVVLQPGQSVTLDELQDLSRQHIAGYKIPRSVTFAGALPLSAQGKVLKRELRAELRQTVSAS